MKVKCKKNRRSYSKKQNVNNTNVSKQNSEAKNLAKPESHAVQKNEEELILSIPIPIRKDIEAYLKRRIIGQDEYIRRLTVALYRRFMYGIPTRVLIVGSSGCGKTETISQLAEALGLPYTIEDATAYTEEGYVGNSVEDMVYNLLEKAEAENTYKGIALGIIAIDEIDKKASVAESGSLDVSGRAVQQGLLKMMDGKQIAISFGKDMAYFDTKNLIFICMGAFEGLDKIRADRLGKKRIGFKANEKSEQILEYTEEDFVKYGMTKEFIGRFDCIIEVNKLEQSDLENIIRKSEISAFNSYKAICKKENIELVYSDRFIHNLAKKASSLKIGARGIKNVSNYVFERILEEIMEKHSFTKCTLDDDIVDDNTKYVIE